MWDNVLALTWLKYLLKQGKTEIFKTAVIREKNTHVVLTQTLISEEVL
jgi:hypothetical protein